MTEKNLYEVPTQSGTMDTTTIDRAGAFDTEFAPHPENIDKLFQAIADVIGYQLPEPSLSEVTDSDSAVAAVQELTKHGIEVEANQSAKHKVANQLANKVFSEIKDNTSHYYEPISKKFDKAVADYTKNLKKLPAGDFTGEQIGLEFTTAQITAYRALTETAPEFAEVIHSVISLESATGTKIHDFPVIYTILTPVDSESFNALETASYFTSEGVTGSIAPGIRAALDAGCEFEFKTYQEAIQLHQDSVMEYSTPVFDL